MKKKIVTAVLACVLAGFTAALLASCKDNGNEESDRNVFILGSSEYLLRDEEPEYNGADELTASLAGNETESMQFVLNFDRDVTDVKVVVSELRSDSGDTLQTELFRQYYIEVKTPTTEDFEKGWYPDALIPMYDGSDGGFANDKCDVPAGQNCGYWINVNAAPGQAAGEYTGLVSVSYAEAEETIEIPVSVTVWDFSLPDETEGITCFGLWMDQVESYGRSQGYDDVDYAQLKVDYTMFLLEKYRVCTTNAPYSIDTQTEEFAEYVSNPRVTQYCIPCSGSYDETTEVYVPSEAAVRYVEILREEGLLEKGVFYVSDEPADDPAVNARLAAINRALKELCPECPNIVTTAPRYSCYGGIVDAWCGLFDAESMYEENIRYRQSLGETVWWYGCVTPEYPYPNYQITNDLLNVRLISWMQKDYNISGNLFWSTTVMRKYLTGEEMYVDRDVWTDPNAFGSSPGDGYLVYPGFEGDGIVGRTEPVPTIRLNNIRDGIEDYIYLELYEDKLSEVAEKLGFSADTDMLMDTFYDVLYDDVGNINYDDSLVESIREIIAHEIMAQDDVIISQRPYSSSDIVNGRRVEVYAAPGLDVVIDGISAEEENMGSYSLYTAVFDASGGIRRIEIAVDGNNHALMIAPNTDVSWMNELVRKVYEHTNSLGLYGDQYIQNYKDNFAAGGTASSAVMAGSVYSELSVSIPVLVQNTLSLSASDGKLYQDMVIYVPEGAQVEVDGTPAESGSAENGVSRFLFRFECSGAYAAPTISVSYQGKTESFVKYMPVPFSDFRSLYDMSSQDFTDAVADANPGMELSFSESGVTAELGLASISLSLPVSGTASVSDFREYDVLYIELQNPSSSELPEMDIVISGAAAPITAGSSAAIAPGGNTVVEIDLTEVKFTDENLSEVFSIQIVQSGADIREDTVTVTGVSVANKS